MLFLFVGFCLYTAYSAGFQTPNHLPAAPQPETTAPDQAETASIPSELLPTDPDLALVIVNLFNASSHEQKLELISMLQMIHDNQNSSAPGFLTEPEGDNTEESHEFFTEPDEEDEEYYEELEPDDNSEEEEIPAPSKRLKRHTRAI